MTMRRQYQLPNCSLILDGLSIDPSPGSEDIMSLLVNAECRISGLERSLNGGYNFFAALVRAVSQYAQEVLSGYAHPQVVEGEPLLVHINPGDGPYHHLVVQPEIADLGEAGDGRAIDIKLSAVQLFDLTEAVDQFFDDKQTLPELEPALSPLAKRFVRSEEPLSDRAVPAVLGVGTLVAATMAFGLLPTPELRDPNVEANLGTDAAEVATTDGATASGEPPSGDSNAADGVSPDGEANNSEPTIDPEDDASEAITALTDTPDEDAESSSSEASAEAADATARSSDEADDASAANTENGTESIADETDEADEIDTADEGDSVIANSTTFDDELPAVVNSFAEVRDLNGHLKHAIVENRSQPRFGEAVSYRVRINTDGEITGYQPVDSQARGATGETPLPGLVKSSANADSTVDYRVVFTERGVVEVSPWFGWSYYE